MARIEEKTVAVCPCHVRWVVIKEFRIKDVYKICSAHCSARVARICFFNHCGSQNTNVISCFNFNTFTHFFVLFSIYFRQDRNAKNSKKEGLGKRAGLLLIII